MSAIAATLTSKFQLTLPKLIREAFGLQEGDQVSFRLRPDGTAILQPLNGDALSFFGALKPRRKGVTLEQMDEAIRKGSIGK